MKKCCLLLLSLTVLFLFVSSATFARAEENIYSQIEDKVDREADKLDISDFEIFCAELENNILGNRSIRHTIKEMTKGNIPLSPQELISSVFKRMLEGFSSILPELLSIVMIAVLFSLIFGLTSDFVNKQTVEIVYFVCYSAVILIVMTLVAKIIIDVKNVITTLTNLMNALFPPLITLMAALGGSVSSAVYKPQLALFSTLTAGIVNSVVIPIFIVTIIFSVVGNLSKNVKLDKLQSALRSISTWVLSITFGLYILYMTVAGISGGLVDTVSLKAAKFMVSSYVPILGGYLSQGFDLISASLVLIKNSLGITGLLITLGVVITPIVKIVTLTVGLKIIAGVIEAISDKRMSNFVSGVASCTTQLIAAVLGTSFVFLITLLLIICTCNAGII